MKCGRRNGRNLPIGVRDEPRRRPSMKCGRQNGRNGEDAARRGIDLSPQ